jgi:hypothetical protein
MQLGREHTLYFPHGHVQSGAAISSLQVGQRGVLLGGSADMASSFRSLFHRCGSCGDDAIRLGLCSTPLKSAR